MPIHWIDMRASKAGPDDSDQWVALRDEMVRRQKSGELALLVGSGVSQFAPSGVPTGMRIANSIRDLLLRELEGLVGTRIREELREIPFEVLMGRCAEISPEFAGVVAAALTDLRRPNPCHVQIAKLVWRAASYGAPCPVVTTNYDRGIELAAGRLNWPGRMAPHEVTLEDDIDASTANDIFHIHGSVLHPGSIVMDYKDEFVLEPWKRPYLRRLLSGKLLIVHGFSGHDLDVCRELVGIPLAGVVWIRASREDDKWPTDARDLMHQRGGIRTAVAVDGRFERVFLTLGAPIRPRWKAGLINHRLRALLRKSTPSLVTAWAYWTGLRAGHGALASALPPEVQATLPERLQWEIRSFGDYYSARHLTGAKGQAWAARLARAEPSLAKELYHRNNEVEFLSRGGYSARMCATLLAVAVRHAWRSAAFRRDSQADREWKNLWATLRFLWPLFQIRLYWSERWGTPTSSLRHAQGPLTGDLDKDLALDAMRSGFGDVSRLEERYRWLGQPARLINLNRLIALRALRGPFGTHNALDEARGRIGASVDWARLIKDPCRLGRSRLARLECHLTLREARKERGVSARDRAYANNSWAMLASAELAWHHRLLPRIVYRLGLWFGACPRSSIRRLGHEFRLLALYGLETP